jgi:diguanylate cyclase (GGDEF)-like protein
VGRLCENQAVKVLVVDDSPSFRMYLEGLLKQYRYRTLTAADGKEALAQVERHPDISLVITDYNMPNMNGQELIQALRRDYRREDLAIIGLSDRDNKGLSARLLKTGANDFLNKPFEVEEFYCRVTQNTNMISYVRQVRDSATRDFLTRVYNRRHLFDVGETLYANARRGRICLGAALIDADHFKRINDTWGHQVGDQALKAIADTLTASLRKSDIVARYGGEEFVCLAVLKAPADAKLVFERVRANLEAIELEAAGERVRITASVGVTLSLEDDLDAMLQRADEAVYKAKEAGRNRVVID